MYTCLLYTSTVALLGGGTDDFPVVGNSDMAVFVCLAVAFAKAIDEDAGILIAVVDDLSLIHI